jgi:hypothetical protein
VSSRGGRKQAEGTTPDAYLNHLRSNQCLACKPPSIAKQIQRKITGWALSARSRPRLRRRNGCQTLGVKQARPQPSFEPKGLACGGRRGSKYTKMATAGSKTPSRLLPPPPLSSSFSELSDDVFLATKNKITSLS